MNKLKNKVAVITGGNSGIGLATAKRMVEEGAKVIITGRKKELVDEAARSIGAVGIVSDQSNLDDIDNLVRQVRSNYGGVDILFLNAGIASFLPVGQATTEHFDAIFNTNVRGVYFTIQKFLDIFNDGGSIIFNTSSNATLGMPNSSVYSASKAALLSISRVLSAELAHRKIRVNSISPGPVETPIFSKLGMTEEQMQEMAGIISKKVLLNRFANPNEIAETVLFMASEDSSFITGAELKADGGISVNTVLT